VASSTPSNSGLVFKPFTSNLLFDFVEVDNKRSVPGVGKIEADLPRIEVEVLVTRGDTT
jgi:hypothetical protein